MSRRRATLPGRVSIAHLVLAFVLGMAVLGTGESEGRLNPVRFRHLSVEEGLRHSVVYSLRQDSLGFMWFATEGGLVRFDGYDFTHFEHLRYREEAPSSQDASFVFEDSQQRLWIGTWGGGLECFHPDSETLTYFRHEPGNQRSLSDDRIHTIMEDRSGTVWVTTFRGLSRFDPAVPGPDGNEAGFTRFLHDPENPASLAHDRVWSISQGPEGALWLGTDRGVDRLDPETGSFEHFGAAPDAADSLSHATARVVYHDRAGTLWVGTQNGLNRALGGGRFERFLPREHDPTSLPDGIVNALLEDSQGTLWVGTQSGGLSQMDQETGRFVSFQPDPADPSSLSNRDVRALWEDRTGDLWIATRGGGVNVLGIGASPFHLVAHDPNDANSLSAKVVLSILAEPTGTVWIGTTNGLNRLEGGEIERFLQDPDNPRSLSNGQVFAIALGPNGGLWVGTYGGLNWRPRGEEGFRQFFRDPDDEASLSSSRIQALLFDRRGHLWAGTRRGLNRRDPQSGRWTQFLSDRDDPATLSDDFIWSLYEDREGSIWVGTDIGGLNRLDPESGRVDRFVHDPNDASSLSNNRVRAIYEDAQGILWIGTHRGLNRLDPRNGEIERILERDGLPNASIHGVEGDDQGHLWISSNDGLARLDPSTRSVWSYGPADGLQGRIFSWMASHRGPDGRLYFGGHRGLNHFSPAEVPTVYEEPPVVLTGFRVFNELVELDRAAAFVDRLELSYRENFFAFEFASLDFRRAETLEYAYQLEGFDPEWIFSGPRRQANYTNVRPGRYTFRVRTSRRDGSWSEPAVNLELHLAPAFWHTWWFRTLASILGIALVLALHLARVRRLRRQQDELELLVAKRTAEVEHKRAHLTTVHEIVRDINAELEFPALLRSILEGVASLEGAERGLALARDRQTGLFEVRAGSGWQDGSPEVAGLSTEELGEYLADTVEVSAGILLGPSRDSRLRRAEAAAGGRSAHLLVMRADLERTVGYLVFSRLGAPPFAHDDPEGLASLHDHVVSAFVRGRMLAELRELNRKKNEFLGFASHDLRTPLGGIIGHTDLLRRLLAEGKRDEDLWDRFLVQIRTASEQMLALVSDLLDVAAIEAGKIELRLQSERLGEMVREQAALLHGLAMAKSIELLVETDDRDLEVLVDRSRLVEVIDNVLSNAIKFTPSGGRVRVYFEQDDDYVITHVEDNGQGLTEADLAQLFSGKKLSASPTAGETSTGLGLLIVRKIIDLHQGRLSVDSERGRGTTFSFSLPRSS